MMAVGFLGVVIERIAYAPMLKAPRLSILITALAVSLVLQNGVLTLTNGPDHAVQPEARLRRHQPRRRSSSTTSRSSLVGDRRRC